MGAPLSADYWTSWHGWLWLLSPDHGGVTRARKLAGFETPIAIIDKRRSEQDEYQWSDEHHW